MSAAASSRAGLSSEEAARRLQQHGPNELARQRRTPWVMLLLSQFKSAMVALLGVAAAVSLAMGEALDATAIAAILVINAVVGFLQEHRAERAIFALRSLTAPRARVVRDGATAVIPAGEVVPGDLLVLEPGDVVAADARLVQTSRLSAVEASLTGESMPTQKSASPCPEDAPLADRHDRVYLGTSIAAGTGLAEVDATGMRTEMGRIATLLQSAEREETPLQKSLAAVGRSLALACGVVCAAVAALGLVHGVPPVEVLLTAISLAVAAVPEGLPAIVTIALAIGVTRLALRNVLVRRLPAVETLGCTTVICTDKTGTLTTGVMTVRDTWGIDRRELLLEAAACCDAEISGDGERATGDPTEIAILRAALQRDVRREDIERANPRVETWPFDQDLRRMAVLRSDGVLRVKGAIESVLPLCTSGTDGAQASNDDMASRGLRVLAVAVGHGAQQRGMRLVGLLGLADPPRTEAIEAVATARRAGIRTVMLTGDHAVTARAIAKEMGIVTEAEDASGLVHARITPEEKLRTVREWKGRGAIVAMTGDGVNDAPALRESHVGIAMGKTGTEVTREASDMVLADDNYASIVAGIREGRGVWDNIRKTLVYLLTGNAAELGLMLAAALCGLPVALIPLQLLWINLVTDGLPALALVMDPADPALLDRPPRNPRAPMLGVREWKLIAAVGMLEAAVSFAAYCWALNARDETEARAIAFATLVHTQIFRVLAARSTTRLYLEVGVLSNVRLAAVVVLTAGLQAVLPVVPVLGELLGVQAMVWRDVALTLVLGLIPVTVLELAKLAARVRARA